MTEHRDGESHEAKADDVERQLDAMGERSERLEGDIEGTGDEWERKKSDPGVPGAAGKPSETGGDGDDREQGDSGEELDFGRDIDPDAVAPGKPAPDQDSDDDEDDR